MAGRDALPTVPQTMELELPRTSSVNDEAPYSSGRPRLTWAVDMGEELRAMSTVDLWYSLNTGDLPPEIRVWRLGLEGWSPARDVPELACAVRTMPFDPSFDEGVRTTLDYSYRPAGTSMTSLVERVGGGPATDEPFGSLPCVLTSDIGPSAKAAESHFPEGVLVDAASPLPSCVREPDESGPRLARRSSTRLTRGYAAVAAGLGATLAIVSALAAGDAGPVTAVETTLPAVEAAVVADPPSPEPPAPTVRDEQAPAATPLVTTQPAAKATPPKATAHKAPTPHPRARKTPWRPRPTVAKPSAGKHGQSRTRRSST